MDELSLLREALTGPEAEPSAAAVARGRNALLHMAASASATTLSRPRRWARGPLLWSAAAVAVAAVTVTLAVPPEGGSASPPRTAGRPAGPGGGSSVTGAPGASPDGRRVLLAAAADIVAHGAPTTGGAYWTTRTISLTTYTVQGGYRVTARRLLQLWVSRDGSRTWLGTRTLGAEPATAADRAAWQRAGSPGSFTVPASSEGAAMRIDSAAGPLRVNEIPHAAARHSTLSFGGCDFTPAQTLALPGNQQALEAKLTACAAIGEEVPMPSGVTRLHPPLWGGLTDLLTDWPITPATQAAAYRLLAAQADVRDLGPATDPLGRSGVQLLVSDARSDTQVLFLMDPISGQVLSESKTPGSPNTGSSQLGGSWTDRVGGAAAEGS